MAREKQPMALYYTMALFLMIAALAAQLSGWLSMILAVLAMGLAAPMFTFPAKLRWPLLLLLTVLIIVFFPNLEGLRESVQTQQPIHPGQLEVMSEKSVTPPADTDAE